MSTSIVLKRNIKIRKIFLGSIIGSLSTFLLLFNLNNLLIFLFKLLFCITIILMTFGYKDIKYFLNNLLYFFIISIILGGFLYYLNIKFSYKNIGMVFYHKNPSINLIFLVISSPTILYIYIRQIKSLKVDYSLYYEVVITMDNNQKFNLIGFMDTANNLIDPYKKRPVIIVNSKKISKNITKEKILLVPYDTINSHDIIECFKPKDINVKGIGKIKNVLIGINDINFKMDGVNCILNRLILKEKT